VSAAKASGIAPNVSFFKPSIAKIIYLKYSDNGNTVYDYSAGWGGRMLGAASCGRKYIGVDPHTTQSLSNMALDLGITNIDLRNECSENFRPDENSIDFAFSSPPYFDIEVYSDSETQAYSKGEDYFYNVYWKNTLINIKHALKPGKFFALNVKGVPRMLTMAQDEFGSVIEEFKMLLGRGNLNHKTNGSNFELVYIFRNDKS
jgi:hypothetical protein